MTQQDEQAVTGQPHVLIRQDERGRWTVRFRHGAVVGHYTALSRQDALDFADSADRQTEHLRFAYTKGKATRQ